MNKSQKTMEWLTCFSVVNLTLGCLLFKKFKKFNESCSFSKAARISERTQTWCAAEIPDLSTSNCFKKRYCIKRKVLLHSAINERNTGLQHVPKGLSQSKIFISKQLSTIDFYIFHRSARSHNKKLLQKLLNTQQKKLSLLTRNCSLPKSESDGATTNLTQFQ